MTNIDFAVEDHGSICLVVPISGACRDWLIDHTEAQWFAGGIAVEPRYLRPLMTRMLDEGFAGRRRS